MFKVVSMKGHEKSPIREQRGPAGKSVVFLVDSEHVTRSNTVFLFKLKDYLIEDFEVGEMALNRLEQVWDSEIAPFCLVINHGDLNQNLRRFLETLEEKSLRVPVLIVDREKFNLRRDDYCRTLSPDFPLFICGPDELVEFTAHLHVLKNRLKKMSNPEENASNQVSRGLV